MLVRKNYLIDKEMQGKFVMTILALILLVSMVSLCNMFVLTHFYATSSEISFQNNSPLQIIITAFKTLWPRLFLLLMVNIIIITIVCVMYSHQTAGPAYNLNRICRKLAEGDMTVTAILRKNDNLQEVATNINQMTRNIQGAMVVLHNNSERCFGLVNGYKGNDQETQELITGLKLILSDNQEQIRRFKLTPEPSVEELADHSGITVKPQ